jgi:hypothetical protein
MVLFKQIKTQNGIYYMCFKCFWLSEEKKSMKLHICTKQLLENSIQYKTNINGEFIINIKEIIKDYNNQKEFNLIIDS